MISSRCWRVTEIPRAVRAQEGEIESMFRNLLRSCHNVGLHYAQVLPDDTREQELATWIFIAVLGIVSIIGFCLLFLKI